MVAIQGSELSDLSALGVCRQCLRMHRLVRDQGKVTSAGATPQVEPMVATTRTRNHHREPSLTIVGND